ncbi:MAG: hypothetical protein OEM38_04360 [Gammaproteobacteria bacterium]|nr:hypothetical protein [Gammaproteobacteria bacterium]
MKFTQLFLFCKKNHLFSLLTGFCREFSLSYAAFDAPALTGATEDWRGG